jgi:hypothetical protein
LSDLPEHAAVDPERGAGRGGRLFRAEVDDHVRDLVGRREASQQRRRPHRLQEILLGLLFEPRLAQTPVRADPRAPRDRFLRSRHPETPLGRGRQAAVGLADESQPIWRVRSPRPLWRDDSQ